MIFEKLKGLLAEQFAVDENSITLDTSFADDLGADSLDIVELVMMIEEEFGIPEADEDELVKLATVGDVADYIAKKIGD